MSAIVERPTIPLGQGMCPLWPDMTGPWPGEPSEALTNNPELIVTCPCGERVPFADTLLVPCGPLAGQWRCLDCWIQSRGVPS